MINQQALDEMLLQKEQDLLEQLDAVRKLLGKEPLGYNAATTNIDRANGVVVNSTVVNSISKKKEPAKAEGTPKGQFSWETYVVAVLKELGGKRKSSDVIQYAIKANPKIPKGLVETAITNKLSKLYRKRIIDANTSGGRSQGYLYYAKTDQKADNYNHHHELNPITESTGN